MTKKEPRMKASFQGEERRVEHSTMDMNIKDILGIKTHKAVIGRCTQYYVGHLVFQDVVSWYHFMLGRVGSLGQLYFSNDATLNI